VLAAREGASVVCADRDQAAAEETAAWIEREDGSAHVVVADVADADACGRLVEEAGDVDGLVLNVGIGRGGGLAGTSPRDWDATFAVNLRAPLIACQQVVPGMKERGEGSILNVSSMAALNYFPGLMAYGMSKIALEHMTVSLATQLAPFDIAVNTFRIDIAVASEGFVANMPDADHSNWEPTQVPAEGILWMLRQPPSYTGQNEAMSILRETRGIMKSRVGHPTAPSPGTNRVNPMPFLDPTGAPVTGVEA